ncbi:TFIIB-type zinc ribbon-containing protein [Natronomonas halophila]|uniref:DUF7117 family protein n=1 Tax=Natronomonas halophila TaxID=2747817 RepID=UPI0015B60A8B|nr:TFIIB-type zinc ribbon-containing protein [Natronomonas halophila]QLD84826.1 TFIIB-type zinc ribbon-containing protein [Natronomonas halophila]
MKIRGQRECKECGTRWSYYDTGEVACPECGSLHSVGVDEERALHTAAPKSLDLTPIRNDVDEVPLRRLAERATERAKEYTAGYGFIDAGDLQPLDDTYLAAMELRHVAGELARKSSATEDEELYFTKLLQADEGERPDPEEVPDSLRALSGLAYANAVEEYRSDLRTYLDEHADPTVRDTLERLADHTKRIRALDGDVPPREAETLVAAARDVGRYLIEGDEGTLTQAENRLDGLV